MLKNGYQNINTFFTKYFDLLLVPSIIVKGFAELFLKSIRNNILLFLEYD